MIDVIPFRTNKLTTKLTRQEVVKRIDLLIERYSDLVGYAEIGSFVLERKIGYQNPFKPIVKGQIREGKSGTELIINYRPKTSVLVFYFGIIMIFVFGMIKFSGHNPLGQNPSRQFLAAALILFLILMIGYNVERSKIERRIIDFIK